MSEETDPDEPRILSANAAFYAALTALDLPAMEAAWAHEPRAVCVHPGREALHGWEDVRTSWERIFAATGWMHVEPTDVRVVAVGELAVVTCSENITTRAEGGVGVASTRATNVFAIRAGAWRMLLHHASPVPVNVAPPGAGAFQ
jgi:ketosteroid isomerase-like protein